MTTEEILSIRLFNHQLSKNTFKTPSELVKWLGGVQSQDFLGAKWALSQRLDFISNEAIEKSFNDGEILRTHVMRPTWHFVHSEDISWMLELTAIRVKSIMRSSNKNLGLDEEIFDRSKKIIKNELKGNNYLTRNEIEELLRKNGIKWGGNGLAHIVMWAEIDQLICSGPMKGKQQSYALFDERVHLVKNFSHDEAIRELAKRYFQSHGPAQIKDYVWWSGLTTLDAKKGIGMNSSLITHEDIEGKVYYFFENKSVIPDKKIYLIPNYDEYTIAYKDRGALYKNVDHTKLDERQNALFNNSIIIDGKVEGLWRRAIKSKEVSIEIRLFRKLTTSENNELEKTLIKYSKFLELIIK